MALGKIKVVIQHYQTYIMSEVVQNGLLKLILLVVLINSVILSYYL